MFIRLATGPNPIKIFRVNLYYANFLSNLIGCSKVSTNQNAWNIATPKSYGLCPSLTNQSPRYLFVALFRRLYWRANLPIQQKDRWFCKAIFLYYIIFYIIKQPSLSLNGEVIWQASSDSFILRAPWFGSWKNRLEQKSTENWRFDVPKSLSNDRLSYNRDQRN